MNCARFVPLLAAAIAMTACSTTPKAVPRQHPYTLVLIKTGPMSGKLSEKENEKAFEGHFSNMGRLAEERKLVLAGPYGKDRHDMMLRGLFVVDTGNRQEATEWASTDPTTQAGVFVLEFHDLATGAPLQALLERNLEQKRKDAAEGRVRKPGEDARGYVLLIAPNKDRARRELAPLMDGGGVLLMGDLDGAQMFAILDAQDVGGARARFGPALGRIGPHTLDDWFASNQVAHLRDM